MKQSRGHLKASDFVDARVFPSAAIDADGKNAEVWAEKSSILLANINRDGGDTEGNQQVVEAADEAVAVELNPKDSTAWMAKMGALANFVEMSLLNSENKRLREQIAAEGWGQGFCQPKWISTHYTILDLKNLAISRQTAQIKQSLLQITQEHKGPGTARSTLQFQYLKACLGIPNTVIDTGARILRISIG